LVAAFEVHTLVALDILAAVAVATVVARVVAMYPLVVAKCAVVVDKAMVVVGTVAPANTIGLAQIDLVDQAGVD
jgi:hypothetical protein